LVLAHLLDIAHGLAAAIACAALFFVAGLALVPARFACVLNRAETPAMLGAASYVLVCWVGVTGAGVPLIALAPAFAAAVILLATVRWRWVVSQVRTWVERAALRWLLAFVAFYILIYLFTMPPVGGESLPLAWLGNIDLLTYIRYTKYVLHLGPSNLPYPDFSYLGFIYLQTPAVFYLLGALSFFFHLDPLTAAMPAAFSLAALIALVAARISRSIFGLRWTTACAIGAVLLAGPFSRYIFGNYFLSTLMSVPVVLYLGWRSLEVRPTRVVDAAAAPALAAAWVLLLFLYPLLLGVGLAVQAAVVGLLLVADAQDAAGSATWRASLVLASRRLMTIVVPLVVLALVLFRRVVWSVDEVLYLSRPNVNGWPLDLISPLAILGAPGAWFNQQQCWFCVDLEIVDPVRRTWAMVGMLAGAALLMILFLWPLRARTSPPQRALAGLGAGAFVAYAGFFLLAGVSYQQWKFGSYTALPWSFAAIAAIAYAAQQLGRPVWARLPGAAGRVLLTLLVLAIVGGNLWAHRLSDPAPVELSAGLRNLAALNDAPAFRELSVKMDETFDGLASWLALYLLPDKQVHVISRRNDPREELSYDTISRQRPLLVQNFGCEGIGHDETRDVPGVGCLIFAPPSLALDVSYPFNQTWWFVTFTGLGAREPAGRWNTDALVHLDLMGDIQRVGLFDPAFVNLQLAPYLPPGTPRQRLQFAWGRGRRSEIALDRAATVSLPVTREDWSGVRMWTLPLDVALPDRLRPDPMYAPRGHADDPPLAAIFESISVTRQPAGTPIASSHATPTH
jgi:hypothetical protein